MKKILGLDIGTTSIGWAIVDASDEKNINVKTGENAISDINNDRIGIHKDAIGVRIISQDSDNIKSFTEGKKLNAGNTKTPCAKRRQKRGIRRMNNRYKMRRDKLCTVLELLGMLPDCSYEKQEKNGKFNWKVIENINSKWYTKQKEYEANEKFTKRKKRTEGDIGYQLYKLRNNAINIEIDLKDWGRILLHLNQLRGYSSDRFKKEEGEKFNYLSGTVTSISEKPILFKYDDDSETELINDEKKDNIRWMKYSN